MSSPPPIPGLASLQAQTLGSGIRVAVLDGPVDVTHPCFHGARLTSVSTLVHDEAGPGQMSRHGTHVTSVLLGQRGTPVQGVAPGCMGILVPVFQDYREGELPQLDLARAVEQAVLAGAQIINISGGERSADGNADPLLERALKVCEDNGVLVVAAAGNDGCECVHVPAALPSVLAVGALGRDGRPLPSSNWGPGYRMHGLLAPGEAIPGAVPGGGTANLTGTSFATPIVTGVAALLISLQLQAHGHVNPRQVRNALLASARGCVAEEQVDCDRYIAGVLDIARASAFVLGEGTSTVTDINGLGEPSAASVTGGAPATAPGADGVGNSPVPGAAAPPGWMPTPAAGVAASLPGTSGVPDSPPRAMPSGTVPAGGFGIPTMGVVPQQLPAPYGGGYVLNPSAPFAMSVLPVSTAPMPATALTTTGSGAGPSAAMTAPAVYQPANGLPASVLAAPTRSAAEAAEGCACGGGLGDVCHCGTSRSSFIYALGSIGFDFGHDTRRDTFRQLMPPVERTEDDTTIVIEANPFDPFQLSDYLDANPHESTKLIWTLNLDLTPIYAIEAEPYYPESVYQILRTALRNQALPAEDNDYVSRVSIPGVLTGRTVELFSGQVVPVVMAQRRGLHIWNETQLINAVIAALRADPDPLDFDEPMVRKTLRSFLDKVYIECRNLGQSPPDRALNFVATNAFQAGRGIAEGLLTGRTNVVGAEDIIYTLDTIDVVKSPFCRINSLCYDVRLKWFNPDNDRFAKSVYQFTVDVADGCPATLAPAHQYLST